MVLNPLSWGDLPEDSEATRLGKRNFILSNLVAVVAVLVYVPVFAAVGLWPAVIVLGTTAAAHTGLLLFLRATRRFSAYIGASILIGPLGFALGAFTVRGVPGIEANNLWLIVMLVSAALTGRRERTLWMTVVVIGLMLGFITLRVLTPPWPMPTWFNWVYPSLTFGMAAVAFVSMVIPVASARRELTRALREEHDRSERLLLNVMPPTIAGRLKAGETTIADRFDVATVLFADIVGFTTLSAAMPPERLVAMLDGIFSELDALAKARGVEKIKTIGDAYMVVGGVPVARADHAEAVLAFAVDMMATFTRRADGLKVRVGIHTGPVVAGVIGKQRFLYDLWGDTVNTASRLESHGVPGRIQLSEATRALVTERYAFEDRGEVSLKGKGPTRCFLVADAGVSPSPGRA